MIKHLRIDNRLIHGQVAVMWRSRIGAERIIVTNDKVAADPIQKMALPMAARGTPVSVFTIAETLAYVNEHPNETFFIICKLPSDALEILASGVEVETVNVGNAAPPVGRTDYKMILKNVACTPEEADQYRQIAAIRGGLSCQIVPTDEPVDIIKLLKDNGL